jgi:hypothetical protein
VLRARWPVYSALVCALLGGLASIAKGWAAETPEAAETARLIDAIEKARSTETRSDREAARRLNAEGDRAYRRKDYKAAFTAYANSYPNAPNAHAYIMAGDAHWRGVLRYHARQTQTSGATTSTSCRLTNSYFASDLAMDVAQHQALGLALAVHDNDRRILDSAFYRRARASSACLQALAKQYAAEPPTSCVDLDRLRGCLGAPLIR